MHNADSFDILGTINFDQVENREQIENNFRAI